MEINIEFDIRIPNHEIFSKIAINVLEHYLEHTLEKNYNEINLLYIFQSEEDQIKLNKEFLDHDYDTDIITFDFSERDDEINGEMYLSLNQIINNSREYNTSEIDELFRVLIHGVLHLIGYNDKTKEESALMKNEEDKFIEYTKTFHVEQ